VKLNTFAIMMLCLAGEKNISAGARHLLLFFASAVANCLKATAGCTLLGLYCKNEQLHGIALAYALRNIQS
jgi:hypothetical protein